MAELPPEDDLLGRRSTDRYLGPEAVGVLLVELSKDIQELKTDVREGFRGVGEITTQLDSRIDSLERFRERVEERDKALARSEGRLEIRFPVLMLWVGLAAVVISLLTLALSGKLG